MRRVLLILYAVLTAAILLFPHRIGGCVKTGNDLSASLGHSFLFVEPTKAQISYAIFGKQISDKYNLYSFIDWRRSIAIFLGVTIACACAWFVPSLPAPRNIQWRREDALTPSVAPARIEHQPIPREPVSPRKIRIFVIGSCIGIVAWIVFLACRLAIMANWQHFQ